MSVGRSLKATIDYLMGTMGGAICGGVFGALLGHDSEVALLAGLAIAQHGMMGDMKSPVDMTYLADSVILLRFFEAEGRVRRAISVVKKRTGAHEDSIRELQITDHGIVLGQPLKAFHGILRGVPTYHGPHAPLLPEDRS